MAAPAEEEAAAAESEEGGEGGDEEALRRLEVRGEPPVRDGRDPRRGTRGSLRGRGPSEGSRAGSEGSGDFLRRIWGLRGARIPVGHFGREAGFILAVLGGEPLRLGGCVCPPQALVTELYRFRDTLTPREPGDPSGDPGDPSGDPLVAEMEKTLKLMEAIHGRGRGLA